MGKWEGKQYSKISSLRDFSYEKTHPKQTSAYIMQSTLKEFSLSLICLV